MRVKTCNDSDLRDIRIERSNSDSAQKGDAICVTQMELRRRLSLVFAAPAL